MALLTTNQRQKLNSDLKNYKKKYLKKEYKDLDESATRLMINNFLTEVLGYEELDEIKTEYAIKGTYADYVIQLQKKKHIIVEVKAIQYDLSDKHLRQAVHYAADEAIEWVLLTNGRSFSLYRVKVNKKVEHKEIFNYDLLDLKQFNKAVDSFELLTKKCLSSGELEKYWKKFQAVEPERLCNFFYREDFISLLKRSLKKETGMSFTEPDLMESVNTIINTKIDSVLPKSPIKVKR